MFEYDEGDGGPSSFPSIRRHKEDWTVAGDARQELVSRLHEVGEMAVKDGVVIGIRTPLDAGGDIKLLKEINSKGVKIYYSFQNALENGRDLCKELKNWERIGFVRYIVRIQTGLLFLIIPVWI